VSSRADKGAERSEKGRIHLINFVIFADEIKEGAFSIVNSGDVGGKEEPG
jgi:hypothetical protein